MLPRSKRFTKEDFTYNKVKVFYRGEFFDIGYTSLPSPKYACVISKKTQAKAVDRNTIKRKIYSIILKNSPKSQKSLVFYPKKPITTVSYQQLEKEIQQVFGTLH